MRCRVRGTLGRQTIDAAVTRILAPRIRMGLIHRTTHERDSNAQVRYFLEHITLRGQAQGILGGSYVQSTWSQTSAPAFF